MVNKNEKFAFEVVYAKNLPKELKRIFVKALEKYHYVIPTWCHKIYVKYEEQDADGSPAHVQSLERYREAIISIAPSIVGESPEERIDRILLHEFIHILLCPLVMLVIFQLLFGQNKWGFQLIRLSWRKMLIM